MHDDAVTPSLIFDLDGTLIDSLPGISNSLNRTLEKHGLPTHPQKVVRSFVGNGILLLVERAASHASDEQLAVLVDDFKKDYADTWMEGTRPYNGITQLLKELQRDGHQLAVLSNKVHSFTQTITRQIFPLINFMQIVGQQEGIPHKPHPSGAFKIAMAMGRNPHDCILIGDSVADAETAQNAEMTFIGVTWGYQDRIRLMEAGANKFIETPGALPHLLKTLDSDVHA